MRRILFIILQMLFISCCSCSDNAEFKTFGKQNTFISVFGKPGLDEGTCVIQCQDNGYVICGNSWRKWKNNDSTGVYDTYFLKIDQNGQKLWEKTYGTGDTDEEVSCILQTSDGGFIACGQIWNYFPQDTNIYLIWLDSKGIKFREKEIGGEGYDAASEIKQLEDGNYAICGSTNSISNGGFDAFLSKVDVSGNVIWFETYGSNWSDGASSMQLLADGGFIICGGKETENTNNSDIWLLKIDKNGKLEWEKTYDIDLDDWGVSVSLTYDNGYVILGITRDTVHYPHYHYPIIIKTDQYGNIMWINKLLKYRNSEGFEIQQTADRGLIICGKSRSRTQSANYDSFIMKLNKEGHEDWFHFYNYEGNSIDSSYSIKQTSDGGFITCGFTVYSGLLKQDVLVIKTDNFGRIGKISPSNAQSESDPD